MRATLVAVLAASILLAIPAGDALGSGKGEDLVCGDASFSPPPTFDPFTDIPYMVERIGEIMADPSGLFGPDSPWTNWYEEPTMVDQLAKLSVMRSILDRFNLWDMYLGWFPDADCPPEAATVRQIDGTCNYLPDSGGMRAMGAAGTRFGRNVPLYAGEAPDGSPVPNPAAYPDYENLLEPSPREVSRQLFTRDEFEPVPFLNMLAAAWVQFQVHDWFDHGENDMTNFFAIPLAEDDPFRREHGLEELRVPYTAADTSRKPSEAFLPPSHQNQVTQWWDASQIYGSDLKTANSLRAFEGGHLRVDSNGLLPVADDGFEETGMRRNWWLGLALLHTVFVHEHNAIADMLAESYPDWSDQRLYDTARMINAALIAKIHTIEWTPAILPNPTLEVAMNTNWDGLNQYMEPELEDVPPGVPDELAPVFSGVVGGERDLKQNPVTGQEVPFSMTQEFVSVYRMHPLLPDAIDARIIDAPGPQNKRGVIQIRNSREERGRRILERRGMADLLYSFGLANPGALTLNNYPAFLQELQMGPGVLDLGAVDVLRDRERGVPRYNEFRRQLNLAPLTSIDQLTDDPKQREALEEVYGRDAEAIERVDLLVGTLAEAERPTCYGFGETLFQVFTGIATRRLQGDRFYTDDFTPEVYTEEGLAWIASNTMKDVLLRHYPELGQTGLEDVENAFYPWE